MLEFVTFSVFMLLAVISPGPDFIVVTKNALNYNHIIGLYTAIGVSFGALLLAVFSISGLSIVITQSKTIFYLIKLLGSIYLIYLGYKIIFGKFIKNKRKSVVLISEDVKFSYFSAFKEGFIVSSLNPKAILFFIALFSNIIQSTASVGIRVSYAFEIFLLYMFWFTSLSFFINNKYIKSFLYKAEKYINKFLGLFLTFIGFYAIFTI